MSRLLNSRGSFQAGEVIHRVIECRNCAPISITTAAAKKQRTPVGAADGTMSSQMLWTNRGSVSRCQVPVSFGPGWPVAGKTGVPVLEPLRKSHDTEIISEICLPSYSPAVFFCQRMVNIRHPCPSPTAPTALDSVFSECLRFPRHGIGALRWDRSQGKKTIKMTWLPQMRPPSYSWGTHLGTPISHRGWMSLSVSSPCFGEPPFDSPRVRAHRSRRRWRVLRKGNKPTDQANGKNTGR